MSKTLTPTELSELGQLEANAFPRDFDLDSGRCEARLIPSLNAVALRDRHGVHVVPLTPTNPAGPPILHAETIAHLEEQGVPVDAVTAWAVRLDYDPLALREWLGGLAEEFHRDYAGWWPSLSAWARSERSAIGDYDDGRHYEAGADYVGWGMDFVQNLAGTMDHWFAPARDGGVHSFVHDLADVGEQTRRRLGYRW